MPAMYNPSRAPCTDRKRSDSHFLNIAIFSVLIFCAAAFPLYSRQLSILKSEPVKVFYEKPLAPDAQRVARLFPIIKSELETSIGWKVDFRPHILLVPDDETFSMMSGNESFVAYALPDRMLIVVNNVRMTRDPALLLPTLKHELCHLLLHRYISGARLPRWLDEGVCQWTSGGFTELITGRRPPDLAWAALSGRFLPLEKIARNFPEDDVSLSLAYEESRSMVNYIVESYGRTGLLNILNSLRTGHDLKDSIPLSIGIPLGELEKSWQKKQSSAVVILSLLMGNIYTFLFLFAAFLTIAIYIRILVKKRRLKDMEPFSEDRSAKP